ncbi:MAG: hypothetical protein ACRDDZ_02950 [Marinifilaceae bacterium]
MRMFSEVLGNMISNQTWAEKLKNTTIEYLDLDQWTAQKSRFIAKSASGNEYGIALKRGTKVETGDVLDYDVNNNVAVVIRIELKPVMIVDLAGITTKDVVDILRQGIEIGHALGNQHWPAIVKGTKLYVPLTVDKKVMDSVMRTHRFENITYSFVEGQEVLPYLAPHEVRELFGGSSQDLTHEHSAKSHFDRSYLDVADGNTHTHENGEKHSHPHCCSSSAGHNHDHCCDDHAHDHHHHEKHH